MKKLLLLLLVCSFTTLGNQFTVSAGYGLSTSSSISSSTLTESETVSLKNALNLNLKYLIQTSDKNVTFGPYIDYIGGSDWDGSSEWIDYKASFSILSYGIFARYKYPTNGFYYSGSIGLTSPTIDDKDYLKSARENALSYGRDINYNSSINGSIFYILAAGYEFQDNFAVEVSYKNTSVSYDITAQEGSELDTYEFDVSLSTITVGTTYTF